MADNVYNLKFTMSDGSVIDAGNITVPQGEKGDPGTVEFSASTPLMDGTASTGSSDKAARGDHRHPTDTSRQATLVSGTNIKTINGESLLGSGDIAISGGGEYANTSETVGIDSVITLTSTSTLADLGTQILANKTKTISCDINMGNDTTTRTRFCSLIGTPFAAPLGRYIVRVIAASVRPTIEITYSYYSWSSKTATRYLCQGTDGTLNVGSNWWLSDWITPASAVSENESTLLTTGQSASGFWNNSQNPSITTIILNGDASVSFQGTPYGTDIRIVIFYFHPKGSYDDDPTNLAFDFAVMSDSGLWSYAYNKHNVGFTITATSSAVSYNYYTIA